MHVENKSNYFTFIRDNEKKVHTISNNRYIFTGIHLTVQLITVFQDPAHNQFCGHTILSIQSKYLETLV